MECRDERVAVLLRAHHVRGRRPDKPAFSGAGAPPRDAAGFAGAVLQWHLPTPHCRCKRGDQLLQAVQPVLWLVRLRAAVLRSSCPLRAGTCRQCVPSLAVAVRAVACVWWQCCKEAAPLRAGTCRQCVPSLACGGSAAPSRARRHLQAVLQRKDMITKHQHTLHQRYALAPAARASLSERCTGVGRRFPGRV